MNLVKRFTITPLSLFILGAVILRIPTLFEPYWYGDEAIYLTVGEALRQGSTLYLDIFDHKPPLIYLLAAIFGSLPLFKLMLLFWHVITIILFFKLAKIIFVGRQKPQVLAACIFTILTTLPVLEGNNVNSEILIIGPVIGGFILLLKNNKLSKQKLFAAGLLFSVSVLLKVPGVFDFAALVFFWLVTSSSLKNLLLKVKNLFIVTLAFFTPIVVTLIYFWWKGALAQYISVAWSDNFKYIALWEEPSMFQLGLPARGLILFVILAVLFLTRKRFDKNVLFVFVWFTLALFAVLLSARPYPHYLLQAVPPVSLLLGIAFWGKRIYRPAVLSFFLLFLTALVFYRFYYYPTFSYYKNFIQFALAQKGKEEYFAYFNSKTNRAYKVAQTLSEHTVKGDGVFIWGTQPSIYALSRRLPPGRFITSFHIKDFGGEGETLLSLARRKPKYIIVLSDETRTFPGFFSFLYKNYIYVETQEGAQIWKLVSPAIMKALNS